MNQRFRFNSRTYTRRRFTCVAAMPAKMPAPCFALRSCMLLVGFSVSGEALLADETLSLRLTLSGHTDQVESVCFNSDGTTVASGGLDRTIRAWDIATGKSTVVSSKFDEIIDAVAFNPRKPEIAWGTRNRVVRLREIRDGHDVAAAPSGKSKGRTADWLVPVPSVNCAAFSPTGALLAIAGDVTDVAILNVASGKSKLIKVADREVFGVAFSPDGKRLAAGGYEGVHFWEIEAAKFVRAVDTKSDPIFGIAFSPDSALLATAGRDNTVRLWDPTTGHQAAKFVGHSSSVFCVAFSPDGKRLASGGGDQTIRLWDVASRRNLATLMAHDAAVFSLAFHPEGKILVSSSADKTVKLWDVR